MDMSVFRLLSVLCILNGVIGLWSLMQFSSDLVSYVGWTPRGNISVSRVGTLSQPLTDTAKLSSQGVRPSHNATNSLRLRVLLPCWAWVFFSLNF